MRIDEYIKIRENIEITEQLQMLVSPFVLIIRIKIM